MKKIIITILICLLYSCFVQKQPIKKINTYTDTSITKKNIILDSNKSNILILDSNKNFDSQNHILNYKHINYHKLTSTNSSSNSNFSPNDNFQSDESTNSINSTKISKIKEKQLNIEVKEGKLIYSIPDTMRLGNTYTIIIRIKRDINNLKIIDTLYKQKLVNIKTTSSMEVVVIDPSTDDSKSFSILKQNSDKQFIDDSDYTEWVYSVKPLKSGKLKLNIIISIIKNDNKKEIVYFNSVYVKSNSIVVVETFWKKYWQWIMSTIIIPLIIFIYKKRKKQED
jgi:hypothetical protein